MSSYISPNEERLLLLKSGGICAMPNCGAALVTQENGQERILGYKAHIKGESPGSARYDSTQKPEERNREDNLIFLCGSCHTLIDKQPEIYTVEKLLKIKREHETNVINIARERIKKINFRNFSQLDDIIKHFSTTDINLTESYALVTPLEKIKKNQFSKTTIDWILMGMIHAKQVEKYIDSRSKLNPEYGEELRQGFVLEYERLKNEVHLNNDELFAALLFFGCGGTYDNEKLPASLSILIYLFEACEVFEK